MNLELVKLEEHVNFLCVCLEGVTSSDCITKYDAIVAESQTRTLHVGGPLLQMWENVFNHRLSDVVQPFGVIAKAL